MAPVATTPKTSRSRSRDDASPGSGSGRTPSRIRAFLELTKPGITRLVVATAAAGYYLGTRGGFDVITFTHTLIGVALAASGSNALNQFAERDVDARMRRTSRRPLPTGRLGRIEALAFGLLIGGLGILQLVLFVNLTAAALVAASLTSYVLVYTPLKRLTWWCTLVGALPGALPILAGWTAAGSPINAAGLALFGILFLWQMPHFFALAWMYREDYMRGGLRMLTAYDPTGRRTARQIVLYCVALVAVSLLPAFVGVTGWIYAAGAVLLGLAFLFLGTTLVWDRSIHRARRVFIGSVLYLPALLLLMLIDKA
ncbi:MAG: heme o synthase [Gemmatimonadota bacterium]